jgi:hypothetical protein
MSAMNTGPFFLGIDGGGSRWISRHAVAMSDGVTGRLHSATSTSA